MWWCVHRVARLFDGELLLSEGGVTEVRAAPSPMSRAQVGTDGARGGDCESKTPWTVTEAAHNRGCGCGRIIPHTPQGPPFHHTPEPHHPSTAARIEEAVWSLVSLGASAGGAPSELLLPSSSVGRGSADGANEDTHTASGIDREQCAVPAPQQTVRALSDDVTQRSRSKQPSLAVNRRCPRTQRSHNRCCPRPHPDVWNYGDLRAVRRPRHGRRAENERLAASGLAACCCAFESVVYSIYDEE